MKKLIFMISFLMIIGKIATAQTFNCYITNEHQVSPKEYQFDVYIQSTSTDFNFRTFQGAFTFGSEFVPSGATVQASMISGTSELKNYTPNKFAWSSTTKGFQVAANSAGTCHDGTMITTKAPVKVGTFRMVITSAHEFKGAAKTTMLSSKGTSLTGLNLRMAVTKWDANDCSTGTNTTITEKGTFNSKLSSTANNSSLEIYPNPVTDILHLSVGQDNIKTISIVNSVGQKTKVDYTEAKKGGSIDLNVATYTAGNYYLEIYTDNGVVTKKFVKE